MSSPSVPGSLVTVGWLAERLDHPDLVVLDASLGKHRSEKMQIPGARLFDIDGAISERSSALPHMMPSAEHFTQEMRALGMRNSSTAVVYDSAGIYSSARAWWMLRAMGFDRVSVLDGGLPAWIATALPRHASERKDISPGDFAARPRKKLIIDSHEVEAALSDDASAVLDARSRERFAGQIEEPRPGLRRGHMPGAVNLPFDDLQIDGHMRPSDELGACFRNLIGQRKRLVFSCGSGITACILALGADLAGYRELSVYDGSWSEWGLPSNLPVVTD